MLRTLLTLDRRYHAAAKRVALEAVTDERTTLLTTSPLA